MIEWIEYTETAKNPPQNRALLVYCPDFSSIGYEVAVWNGANFETDLHGEEIHDYVKKWSLIFEAD